MAQPLTMPLPASVEFPAPRASPPKSNFILSPVRDSLFIIFAPLLALLVGFLASRVPEAKDSIILFSQKASLVALATVTMTHSHLVIVFFRSHGNRKVFNQFPYRFTLVPLLAFGAMMLNAWCFYFAFTVATLWDVYHSSMQVFGLARIYDTKRGVNPLQGRTLDMLMAHMLYIGPVLAGVNLTIHLNSLKEINNAGSTLFNFIPALASTQQWRITEFVTVVALLFTVYYVVAQVRAARSGQTVAWQKVAMLASTAICSVCAWGFNSFGKAFLIMNCFHAVQYYAIVWWAERDTVKRTFHIPQMPNANGLAFALLVLVAVNYGFWIAATSPLWAHNDWVFRAMTSLVNTVAIMHFWYDGFVWSIRAKAIPT